jgi:hypothetical protein
MSEPARVPTQEELDRLAEAVRRNPGSAEFVVLGEAYLALGRPRDAVTVGAQGLRADPDSVAGRMMVGRALVRCSGSTPGRALKVVKADKSRRRVPAARRCSCAGPTTARGAGAAARQNLDPANPRCWRCSSGPAPVCRSRSRRRPTPRSRGARPRRRGAGTKVPVPFRPRAGTAG